MILRKIVFFGVFLSVLGCDSGDPTLSTIVEIKNGPIKGVQEGELKNI